MISKLSSMSDETSTDLLTNIGSYSLYVLLSSVTIVIVFIISHIYIGNKITKVIKQASIYAKTTVNTAAAAVEYGSDAAEALISNTGSGITKAVDDIATGIKTTTNALQPLSATLKGVGTVVGDVVGGINAVIKVPCDIKKKIERSRFIGIPRCDDSAVQQKRTEPEKYVDFGLTCTKGCGGYYNLSWGATLCNGPKQQEACTEIDWGWGNKTRTCSGWNDCYKTWIIDCFKYPADTIAKELKCNDDEEQWFPFVCAKKN